MTSLLTKMVGWRFHPTKYELINNYLKPKTLNSDDHDIGLVIGEVNFCKYEPGDLLGQSKIKSKDQVGYFFCPRDFKYSNSGRSNRKTEYGFWKPTGKHVIIKDRRTKKVIGTKKSLAFYTKAHPKPLRAGWTAEEYEYIPESNLPKKRDFVLIKLKKNPENKTHKNESHHSTVSISDFEGEPSHYMASDFENQNPNEVTANATSDESELTHHMTSDFENQNVNEMAVNSPYNESELSHHVTSNFENQNPGETIAMSPYEDWLMASDFENPISLSELEGEYSPFMNMYSDFKNQSPYDRDESSLMASDFENQNPNDMTTNSPCEPSRFMASDFENQKLSFEFEGGWSPSVNMPSDFQNQKSSFACEGGWSPSINMPYDFKNQSPYDKGELSSSITYFENQNPNEIKTNSFYGESELAHHVASDFENQNPQKITLMPTYESWLMASDSENQIIVFDFEGESSPFMEIPPDFKNQTPYDNGMSFDFANQNLDNKTDIPAFEEAKCCPLVETPLDFDFQNPNEKSNTSTLEECCGATGLMSSFPEINVAQAMLPEVNSPLLAELEAFH